MSYGYLYGCMIFSSRLLIRIFSGGALTKGKKIVSHIFQRIYQIHIGYKGSLAVPYDNGYLCTVLLLLRHCYHGNERKPQQLSKY